MKLVSVFPPVAMLLATLSVAPNAKGAALSDPLFSQQTYLTSLGIPSAWQYSEGTGITVAVIDNGFWNENEDMAGVYLPELFSFKNVLHRTDISSACHGSSISATIAASPNNGLGISGIAPQSKILRIATGVPKWLETPDASEEEKAELHKQFSRELLIQGAEAIYWAVAKGARVINMSFTIAYEQADGSIPFDGLEQEREVFHKAIQYAYQQNVVLVAAAGNWAAGWNDVTKQWVSNAPQNRVAYPAAWPEVISAGCVCGTDQCDWEYPLEAPSHPEFSKIKSGHNFGDRLDVVVQCGSVPMQFDPQVAQYQFMPGGTSNASPQVAAVAALLLAKKPEMTPEQVRDTLARTATNLNSPGFDVYTGNGQVNAEDALKALGANSK